MLSISLLCFCTFFCISRVQAKVNYHFSKAAKASTTLRPSYVKLPLDHFSNNPATFTNRYWVNDEFYKDGGPVILLDAGETDASDALLALSFGQGADQLPDYATRFGALLILWEHRYYGDSLPSGIEQVSSADDFGTYLQYLTIEQALEDLAVFAKNFTLATHGNQDLRPNNVPWVFVGGSYPGLRAAYMRLRNPEVIYASLASSAPVQLQEDFWQYYVAVERKLTATSGDSGCLKDLHAFADYINTIVTKRNVTAAESLLHNAGLYYYSMTTDTSDSAWENRTIALLAVAETPTGDFQDFGLAGGLGTFCSHLTSPNYTNDTRATASNLKNGIVSYYGIDRAVEIYAAAVAAGGYDFANSATRAGRSTKSGLGRRPDQGSSGTDDFAWLYQTCTEAGFFQDSNSSSPNNIIPAFSNVATWIQEYCVTSFGQRTANGPDVSKLNNKYKGWHMSPTNVLFVNGEYDPWRALSVASDIDPASPGNKMTTTIPAAGQAPPAGTLFGFIIKDGLHVSDLSYDLAAVKANETAPGSVDESADQAHELFAAALSAWLPAYTKFAVANQSVINTSLYTGSYTPTPTAGTTTTTPSQLTKSGGARGKVVAGAAWALTGLALGMLVLA